LTTLLINKKDNILLNSVKNSFDKLVDGNGRPTFNFDKVDQIPFGLTALNLYKVYGDLKYLLFCEILYDKLKEKSKNDGIILYRENSSIQYNDVLGMVVPFLLEYALFKNDPKIRSFARAQIDYYIEYGVDKETYLPAHGFALDSKAKVGSANWGRGIGWYFLGLSLYHKGTGELKKEYDELSKIINRLRTEEQLWSQYPGSSNKFDASSSTMFLYSLYDEMSKDDLYKLLCKYISSDGAMLETSGDTYTVNEYSKSFGKSELSQGFLLLLLSKNYKI